MARTSKRSLKSEDARALHSEFTTFLASLSDTRLEGVLRELLGPEEQLVLAKRFAAIRMCSQEYSAYHIHKALAISSATAHSIKNAYDEGRYTTIGALLSSHHNLPQRGARILQKMFASQRRK